MINVIESSCVNPNVQMGVLNMWFCLISKRKSLHLVHRLMVTMWFAQRGRYKWVRGHDRNDTPTDPAYQFE